MIQQQSASRVQLPSLSAAKEPKHGKRRQLSARRSKHMKTRAHAESDQSSGQDKDQSGEGNSSDGEGQCVCGSSEEVIAISQQTKYVHKKKRSKLKRNDSGSKSFSTSCCTVASGRGSLKRVQHLKTLKTINKARLPLALFIGLADVLVVKLLVVLTGVNRRTRLADFHIADTNEFRLTMRNFYRLRVERSPIQPIERMLPENEKGHWRVGGVFWLARQVAPGRGAVPKADEDACDDDKLRRNAVREVVWNRTIKSVSVAFLVAQQMETAEKADNGNVLVPLRGCVSEGMAEALGL